MHGYCAISPEEIHKKHPVRLFYNFFHENRGPTGTMARSVFTPSAFPRLLPWMIIMEPAPDHPGDYRYRLAGTGQRHLIGMDPSGMRITEVFPAEAAAPRNAEFDRVWHNREVLLSHARVPFKRRSFLEAYRGFFPVSDAQGRMAEIFGVVAACDVTIDAA